MAQTFNAQQLSHLWVQAGGDPKVAPMMAQIAIRESGGQAHIDNSHNGPGGGPLNHNGTVDYGLWAINSVHGYNPQKLYDPLYNAKAAVAVYNSQGPKAWSTYNPATDAKYLGPIQQATRGLPQAGSLPTQQTPSVGGGDMRRQIALQLLGFGNLAGGLPSSVPSVPSAPQTSSPTATPTATATPTTGGVTHFDGKPVDTWIAGILAKARATGLWKGSVNSGYRSEAEQAKLYQTYLHGGNVAAKPGQSNHEFTSYPGGAVDVSDPQGLNRALQKLGVNKLKWAVTHGLADQPHFSSTGH